MLDEELVMVFSAIAETIFGTGLAAESAATPLPTSGALSACIAFEGGFTGDLTATFGEGLARTLAGQMMRKSTVDCSLEDLQDALGEIVNIAAGNLKGLLSDHCQIGLPSVQVTHGQDTMQPPMNGELAEARRVLASVRLRMFEQLIWVELRGTRVAG